MIRPARRNRPFARAAGYVSRTTGSGTGLIRESDLAPYGFPYSERHLRCVWFDPAFRPAVFHTHAGEAVQVLDPGQWNLEPGPDFRGAVLRVGSDRRRIHGDVEIHTRPAGWRSHGHPTDPRYRGIIAHVTYFPGALPAGELPAGALQISLRSDLAANPFFSFENVDVTAYPYAAPCRRAPCQDALAGRSPEELTAFLESAGEERLRVKSERLALAIRERGGDQALYEEFMSALGYKNNRIPFRHLARRVPLEEWREETGRDPDTAYVVLAGVAGLLPDRIPSGCDAEARAYVRHLWDLWWKQKSRWESRVMRREEWALAGLRPPNHPLRRLMAAALLFSGAVDLGAEIRARRDESLAARAARLFRCLQIGQPDGYWAFHCGLPGRRLRQRAALIGAGRAAAILTNVIVPWAVASGHSAMGQPEYLRRLPPEDDNALVSRTAHALLGRDHNPALYRGALMQQGILQIFHDFCLNDRSGCADCPLPEAVRPGARPFSLGRLGHLGAPQFPHS